MTCIAFHRVGPRRFTCLTVLLASCCARASPGGDTVTRENVVQYHEIPMLCRHLTAGNSVADEVFCSDGAVVPSTLRDRCEQILTTASRASVARDTAIECVRFPCPEALARCEVP